MIIWFLAVSIPPIIDNTTMNHAGNDFIFWCYFYKWCMLLGVNFGRWLCIGNLVVCTKLSSEFSLSTETFCYYTLQQQNVLLLNKRKCSIFRQMQMIAEKLKLGGAVCVLWCELICCLVAAKRLLVCCLNRWLLHVSVCLGCDFSS